MSEFTFHDYFVLNLDNLAQLYNHTALDCFRKTQKKDSRAGLIHDTDFFDSFLNFTIFFIYSRFLLCVIFARKYNSFETQNATRNFMREGG